MPRRASADNVVKFTKAKLAALVPVPGQAERIVWDSEVRGFGLRIRATGARTWVIRPPRAGGTSKLHTLGPADAVDLVAARRTAAEKIAEAALGGDHTREKAEARAQAALTLGSLVDRYIADKEAAGRRASTLGNLRNHLNAHWRPLHGRPLNSITRAEVASRHREVAADCGPHAADRARSILSTFYVWAMAEGLAEANPVASTHTATAPTRRDRVLDDAELAAVWRACRDDDFGRIVRLLTLTAARRDEVGGLAWPEVASGVWTLPAERAKNGRPHELPLPPLALDVLRAAPRQDTRTLVFGTGEGSFSGWSAAKARLDARMLTSLQAERGGKTKLVPWRLHDLRRTAATRMADLGVQPHVVEAVLNHQSGIKAGVAGIYNRATYREEKRAALALWAGRVAELVA